MTQEELQTILEKHKKWLNDVPGGEYANLKGANLAGASLRDANLDYSCWPLWCGSLRNVRIDKRIFAQLAYHICRVIVDDDECKAAQITGMKVFMKESLRGLMGADFRQEFPWEVNADDA